MKKFQKAHLWMIIPFLIAIFGFYFSYWSKIKEAKFHHHLHGLTATAWYLLVVVQPFLYQRRSMNLHRKLGMVGVFIAGGVVFSAMQIIPNNLSLDGVSENLRYSFVFADFIFLLGFSFAVLMAVINKSDIDLHARYLFSSIFWAMLPALSRLIYFPLVIIFGFPPPISFQQCVYTSGGLIILVLTILMLLDFFRAGKVYRSYVLVTFTTILVMLTWNYFGYAEWWRVMCHRIFE